MATMRRTSEVCSGRPLRLSRSAPRGQVALERRAGFVAERHHTHLAALAAHEQFAALCVDVVAAQIDQFLTAQTAAVEQFKRQAVAQRESIRAPHGVADRIDL